MNRLKVLIFCILFSCISFAQKPDEGTIQLNFSAKYVPAKLTYTDGHTEDGFVYGFIENRFFEVNFAFVSGFETIENKVNLDDKSFDFKTSLNDRSSRKVFSKELKSVLLIGDEDNVDTQYDYLNIKTANTKGEIVDLDKKIWLPLIKKDNISLYGYNYFLSQNGASSQYLFTVAYLKNAKENYAIPPIDFNRINIINVWKTDDKFKVALKDVIKDCPKLIDEMDIDKTFSKEEMQLSMKKYKEEQKELKEKLKELPRKERNDFKIKFYENKFLSPYFKLIEEYNKTCPN